MVRRSKNNVRPKVVIVGANFAGLKAAVNLSRQFHVTVIDRNPWFEFLPNIHELVSGIKTPAMLRCSNKAVVHRAGHQFLTDTVTQFVPEKNKILTGAGKTLSYDFCVVAVGSMKNTYGVRGADRNSVPFTNVENCHAIGQKLQSLFKTEKPFHVVIVGGGIEGVEALGEILRSYRKRKGLRVSVIEKEKHIIHEAPADIESEVLKHGNPYAVEILTGAVVQKILKHAVVLSDGNRLKSDVTIWAGGVKPHPILMESGFTADADEWAPVHESLQHRSYANVFFAGDAAGVAHVHSKQAYHAIDMGVCAAGNITRLTQGKSLKPFQPSVKPTIISFGDLDAFMIAGNIVVAGTVLNGLKEAVFQKVMMDFDPSGIVMKALHLSDRAVSASLRKTVPMVFSLSALRRLGNIRILSRRAAADR